MNSFSRIFTLRTTIIFIVVYLLAGMLLLIHYMSTSSCDLPNTSDIDFYCPTNIEIFLNVISLPFYSADFWLWELTWPVALINQEHITFIF